MIRRLSRTICTPTILRLGSIILGAIFLFGCDQETESQSSNKQPELQKVVLAEGMQPIAGPVYVAQEKGIWKRLGLEVETVPFTSGRLCLDAVLAGRSDVGTVAETPIMHAGFNKSPIYVLSVMHESDKNTSVLARRDHSVTQPSDLKQRKVGVSVGTNGEFFMESFLKAHGLNPDQITAVNIRPEDMASSLIRGDIDAIFTWQPHIQNALDQLGPKAIAFSGEGIYTETYSIVASKQFAEERPDAAKLFLRGLEEAIAYMRLNETDAVKIVSERTGMTADLLSQLWPNYRFGLSLNSSLMVLLREQAEWSQATGLVKASSPIPDYRSMLFPEPLRSVREDAVGIE